ncbi:hypothetical protein [Arcanobacterium canis]
MTGYTIKFTNMHDSDRSILVRAVTDTGKVLRHQVVKSWTEAINIAEAIRHELDQGGEHHDE